MSVVEFVDDGYSGKNMDRPDMQRMLELVKRKQISCVIVKDFSRFSRDHIEQGKYIEQIFPFMGVRFIAIMIIMTAQITWVVSVRLMLHLRESCMISSARSSLPKYH